jgi:hypothetical protein
MRARTQAEPGRSLVELRKVLERVRKVPGTRELCLQVAADMAAPERCKLLTDEDLAMLEELSRSQAEDGATVRGACEMLQWKLVSARTSRDEEHEAHRLLVALHDSTPADGESRRKVALELASRGARGDEALRIYAGLVRSAPSGSYPRLVQSLDAALDVGLDSTLSQRRRAGQIVTALGGAAQDIPRVRRAEGMRALLDDERPEHAVTELGQALHLAPDDAVSRAALVVALIASDEPAQALDVLDAGAEPGRAVRTLAEAMRWLAEATAEERPVGSEQVVALDVPACLESVRDATAGVMCLIEGEADRARALLTPLVSRRPSWSHWRYHAAWADVLCGVRPAAAAGSWPVASLLGQLDGEFPSAVERFIAARRALGRGDVASAPAWPTEPNRPDASLEALRITIACHLRSGETTRTAEAIGRPLFNRLPLADQTYWTGLLAIARSRPDDGRRLLERSAELGAPNAPLALCAHLLESGAVRDARALLDGPLASSTSRSVELLKAHALAAAGEHLEAERIFSKLTTAEEPRAAYALAGLYARHALAATADGLGGNAIVFWRQADSAVKIALRRRPSPVPLPGDAEALAAAITLAIEPSRWREQEARFRSLHGPSGRAWLDWSAAVCQLWAAPPAVSTQAARALVEWIAAGDGACLPEATLAIARKIALRALTTPAEATGEESNGKRRSTAPIAMRQSDADAAHDLLARLTAVTGAPEIGDLLELVSGARQHSAGDDPQAPVARRSGRLGPLLDARDALVDGDRQRAAKLLRAAPPANTVVANACATLADALCGQASAGRATGTPARSDGPWLVLGVLADVTAPRDRDASASASAIVRALRDGPSHVARSVRWDVLLVPLCAAAGRGDSPAALVEAVERAASIAVGPAAIGAIARCAAAVGASDTALAAWSRIDDGSSDPDCGSTSEQQAYLCHLAVRDVAAGEERRAAERLERAATLGPAGVRS